MEAAATNEIDWPKNRKKTLQLETLNNTVKGVKAIAIVRRYSAALPPGALCIVKFISLLQLKVCLKKYMCCHIRGVKISTTY